VFWVLAAAACGLPRDPAGTLERVQGGVVRVGVVDAPPWASHAADGPRGREVEVVRRLARSLDARVEWSRGGETRLMAELKERGLDLVVGGIVEDSPYRDEVGFTRPYVTCDDGAHVFAGPPGENRWLMTVEALLAGEAAGCEDAEVAS
jgi:polar amino acid transport system substrate-binding protein